MKRSATTRLTGTASRKRRAVSPIRRSEREIATAARTDPDAQPMTARELAGFRRISLAKRVRHAVGMTQEKFAATYGIPLGTLRDWEQHRVEPDQAARTLLTLIAAEPKLTAGILQRAREPA